MNNDLINLQKVDFEYFDTTEVGEYTVKIESDTDYESPREWDCFGTMVCFHRRYNLGDNHDYTSVENFFHRLSGLYPDEYTDYLTEEQINRCADVAYKQNVILPLYLYDHSGITMSCSPFSCPWDSGQVGYIFVSKEKIRKEYNRKLVTKKLREQAIKVLVSEVESYDMYLTGDIHGFTIEKDDGEFVDSCWGFYGSDGHNRDYMFQCIRDAIAWDIKNTPQQSEMNI